MNFRLLYGALLALVFICLQDVVALPTGTRWSSLERRMDSIVPSGTHGYQALDWGKTIFDAAAFLPRYGWQIATVKPGHHSSGTGEPMSPNDVRRVFMPWYPCVQAAYGDFEYYKAFMAAYGEGRMVYIGHLDRSTHVRTGHPPVYAYVDTKRLVLLLFYAGTGSFGDGLIDLDGQLVEATPEHFENYAAHKFKLHKGFRDAMNNFYAAKIKEWVVKAKKDHGIAGVIQGGHSLGGALAALGHVVLVDAKLGVRVQTRSFAAPRVFDVDGAEAFQNTYTDFRTYNHGDDFIPNKDDVKAGVQHPKGVETLATDHADGTHNTHFKGMDDVEGASKNGLRGGSHAVSEHGGPYNAFVGDTPPWGPQKIKSPWLGQKGLNPAFMKPKKKQ